MGFRCLRCGIGVYGSRFGVELLGFRELKIILFWGVRQGPTDFERSQAMRGFRVLRLQVRTCKSHIVCLGPG